MYYEIMNHTHTKYIYNYIDSMHIHLLMCVAMQATAMRLCCYVLGFGPSDTTS